MTPESFRADIIDPTLKLLDLYSPAASNLMLGTALVESGLKHRKQIGGGPARGLFQIEPVTFRDVYGRYLLKRPRLLECVNSLLWPNAEPVDQLYWNDRLGCAIARIRYLYDPQPLPFDPEDIPALAGVWLRVYNAGGAGTIEKFINAWNRGMNNGPVEAA